MRAAWCCPLFRLRRCRAPRCWRPPGGNQLVPGIQLRCARWASPLPVQLWDPHNSVSLIHCCARWPPPCTCAAVGPAQQRVAHPRVSRPRQGRAGHVLVPPGLLLPPLLRQGQPHHLLGRQRRCATRRCAAHATTLRGACCWLAGRAGWLERPRAYCHTSITAHELQPRAWYCLEACSFVASMRA